MTKKHKKIKYIEVRGRATYVIKARTKEEALELAKQRFQDEAFNEHQSFIQAGLDTVITGMAGFEARQGTGKDTKLDMEWKNSKLGSWRHRTDEQQAVGEFFHTTKSKSHHKG